MSTGPGFGGITVKLQSVGSGDALTAVSGVGPEQTSSDGAYSFTGLAAGTYQVTISPSSKYDVGTTETQVTLNSGQSSTGNNFTLLGVQPDEISLRMFLSAITSLSDYMTSIHSPPSVTTNSGDTPATYTSGGTALTIASCATITAPDSPTLTSMTVTLESMPDGSSEQLSADVAGTTLTSNYNDGVLTVSNTTSASDGTNGINVADVSVYQSVLDSLTYSDNAASVTAGDRTVAITVNDGTTTSTAATVTFDVVQGTNIAPSVTTDPSSQTVAIGSTATFTAAANGAPTPTVQWEMSSNGGSTFSDISGATSTTYSLTAASGENGDEYEAVFTNTAGTATSTPATLTVSTVPTVTSNPASQSVNTGQTATFTAAASGTPTPTVQWEVSTSGATAFSDISGATSTTYSFTATSAANGSQYEAVFNNTAGNVTSNPATLTVDYVTTQPGSQTVTAGGAASFTADSSSSSDTVQWEVIASGATAFSAISGATSTTYAFAATSGENGSQYEAVFSNGAGSFSSSPATLTVDYAPAVITNPTSQSVNAGKTATLTAAATGSPTPSVQWEVSTSGATAFSDISGATSTTYSFTATMPPTTASTRRSSATASARRRPPRRQR